MQELRVLTVRQPWAWAIIHAGKDVENRVQNIAGSYRGPIAIHAGLDTDLDALGTGQVVMSIVAAKLKHGAGHPATFRMSPTGAIIGVVDLVDVHFNGTHSERWDAAAEQNTTCSPWAEHGDVHHLVLANPRPLREPIPFKGALGLRVLPSDVAARVWSGVA